ncbi:hypothetical protein E4U24_004143 [Claviceps purpurea]|nr:hypothetical protein E4U24_004143 [Claviceps purpurea]
MDHMGGNLPPPARRPSGHKINRRPFQRSEDLETPAESEEDDHLKTASAEDPPTTTEDPKGPTSENTATWPDPDFSKPSLQWVLPNLRVEPPAIDLKTLQTMMLRDMAVMSQNPPPRMEVRNSPESSDGGSPRGSSLFSTDDLAELWETGVVADTTKSRLMIEDLCKWGRPIGDQNSSDKWALELVTVSRLTNKSQTFEVKYSMLYDRNVPDGELHSPSFDKSLWNLYLWNLTAV